MTTNVDTTRRVLIQLIGKAEGTPKAEDLAEPFEAIDRMGGSMLANVTAAFTELGVPPTERGGGMGEWDCGAFVPAADIPVLLVAMTDRFRAAFRNHLLRWHVAVLDEHTDVFQKKDPK